MSPGDREYMTNSSKDRDLRLDNIAKVIVDASTETQKRLDQVIALLEELPDALDASFLPKTGSILVEGELLIDAIPALVAGSLSYTEGLGEANTG